VAACHREAEQACEAVTASEKKRREEIAEPESSRVSAGAIRASTGILMNKGGEGGGGIL